MSACVGRDDTTHINWCFVSVTQMFDYVFPENGLVAFKDGKEIGRQVCYKIIDPIHCVSTLLKYRIVCC